MALTEDGERRGFFVGRITDSIDCQELGGSSSK